MWDFPSLFEVFMKGFEGMRNMLKDTPRKSEEYITISREFPVEIDPREIHGIPLNRDFGDVAFKADVATHHEHVSDIRWKVI
tara:strand:- start:6846 stop:7091 length:246 start_codon:yes stop_codon:yes gene_type:complete